MSTKIIDDTFKQEIINKNYADLGTEIVLQAVKDYQRAIQVNDQCMIRDCERFFFSTWYTFLTDIEPEVLIYYARTKDKRIYSR